MFSSGHLCVLNFRISGLLPTEKPMQGPHRLTVVRSYDVEGLLARFIF